jgi:hypothetical protein
MKYRTCQEAYRAGIKSRIAHPLCNGLYKLAESKDRIERAGKEVNRISQIINKTRHPAHLMHCTYEDKAIWLKGMPLNVAFRMGYEIVPGLRALEFDGVHTKEAQASACLVESVIDQHLANWDGLRATFSKRVAYEYERMRNGESNALRVVDDALDLINLAVSKLPLNIKQGIQ